MQRFTIRDHIKTVTIAVVRFLLGLRGPSKATNQRLLRERGETIMAFTIREATTADLVALARLHVETRREDLMIKEIPFLNIANT